MPAIGGSIDDLEALAALFGKSASDVGQVITAVSEKLQTTDWSGPVAERFREAWTSDFVPMLGQVVEGFRDGRANLVQARERLSQALY